MRKSLLWILAVTSVCFSFPTPEFLHEKIVSNEGRFNNFMNEVMSIVNRQDDYPYNSNDALNDLKAMFQIQAPTLGMAVINKVLTTLKCAKEYNVEHNHILTVIDYSLPSSEKRLWIFDLKEKQLLFHTYVSHGIKSGALLSQYFSNKYNSKASSIGVYKTEDDYYGREGLSLRLDGLDRNINDNAANRSVVMHGGWYVDEPFIKKYGRAGRSWGCPAVPRNLVVPIINTIKDSSLFVIYYPSDTWFAKSKFLNCENMSATRTVAKLETETKLPASENDAQEDVLFANVTKRSQRGETDPIVVMAADNYERIFQIKAPLTRMLRRQIDNMEYIALSNTEFKTLATNTLQETHLNDVYFVIPVIKMSRGYYATEMKIVDLGKIKEVRFNINTPKKMDEVKSYTVYFEANNTVTLRTANYFIRWLGL